MPDLSFELPLWEAGFARIAGLDEAGRGAWAGPVAAAAVILPADPRVAERLAGVRDSKQMTPRGRTRFAPLIKQIALEWGVGMATASEIDSLGILPATRLAMARALQALHTPPDYLLLDAMLLREQFCPQVSLIKGDQRLLSIAAASVLAKTSRDAVMVDLEQINPGYGFDRHKGYGTARHCQALDDLGVCVEHRASFAPVKAILRQVL
jgi:ribonuclease HII